MSDLNLEETLTQPLPEASENLIPQDVVVEDKPASIESNQEQFNANVHEVDEAGKPRLTKTGKLRKKRGRGASTVAGTQAQTEKIEVENNERAATAMQIVNINYMLGRKIGGAAGEPIQMLDKGAVVYNEEMELFRAVKRLCDAKQINDFPPGVAIALIAIPYWLRVGGSYFEREHRVTLWQAIGIKFKKIFSKGDKNATRVNNRENTERKDNPSTEKSAGIPEKGNFSYSS